MSLSPSNPQPLAAQVSLSGHSADCLTKNRLIQSVYERGYAFVTTRHWTTTVPLEESVIEGYVLVSASSDDNSVEVLHDRGDVLLYALYTPGKRQLGLEIAGATPEAVREALELMRSAHPREVADEDSVTVRFCYATSEGYQHTQRTIVAPGWSEIAENYPDPVRRELEPVMTPDWRPGASGQLFLWQGIQGSGKTYAIRALIQQWRKWCSVRYITDPENFLNNGSSMMEMLLDDGRAPWEDEDDEVTPANAMWNLIILEDSGELLSRDAKARSGQALSRLLNATDGLIGQGLRTLVLISTNEEISELHPAVRRPGRCASLVTFTAFAPDAANAWLERRGSAARVAAKATLADLYAVLDGRPPTPERSGVGFQKR